MRSVSENESRRRVLYVQRPSGGGSATGLHDMILALDHTRYEPIVLCYRPNEFCDRFANAGARVIVLENGDRTVSPVPSTVKHVAGGLRKRHGFRVLNRLVRRDLPVARRIASIIREQRVDLVHHNDNPRGDRASIIAARLAGVPQIGHVRFLADYFKPVDWVLSRFVDYFVYMSLAIERQYRNAVGVPGEKGRVVYDPFDFESLGNGGRSAADVRREFGIGDQDPVVANVGRLVPWKGQDVFLEAMARVVPNFPDIRILIVGGEGRGRDGRDYMRRLQELAAGPGLADQVIFTGFRKDVPAILAASNVIVHSSLEPEPFGRIVVEAMAAGRPVVATDAGGVPEIIDHGSTGVLVPPGDPQRMANAVQGLLRDPEGTRELARRGQVAARKRFSPERFADALHGIYETILSKQ